MSQRSESATPAFFSYSGPQRFEPNGPEQFEGDGPQLEKANGTQPAQESNTQPTKVNDHQQAAGCFLFVSKFPPRPHCGLFAYMKLFDEVYPLSPGF